MRNGNRHTYSQFGKMAGKICYISSASFIVSSCISFSLFFVFFSRCSSFSIAFEWSKRSQREEKNNHAPSELKTISTSIYLLITFCFASRFHLNGKVRRERVKRMAERWNKFHRNVTAKIYMEKLFRRTRRTNLQVFASKGNRIASDELHKRVHCNGVFAARWSWVIRRVEIKHAHIGIHSCMLIGGASYSLKIDLQI